MVDQCPFLFIALMQVDIDTFPFQQHLKMGCDLLSPLTRVCFLPFEQFIKQQMVQFENSILEHLHHHAFSILSLMRYLKPIVPKFYHVLPLNMHLAYSSTSLPSLSITFLNFFHSILTWLRLPHLSIVGAIDVGAHIPSTLYACTCCVCGNERTWTHDVVSNIFSPLCKMLTFT